VRTAAAFLLSALCLGATACGGDGAVSIREAADRYSRGEETMTIKGALVIEYDTTMLCDDVVDDADADTQVCVSPAYHLEFTNGLSPAIEDLELEGDGNGQWVEDVSFHGTLNEGVFTVDE
jgi:hypothetical protein